jgi:hypothetical protein
MDNKTAPHVEITEAKPFTAHARGITAEALRWSRAIPHGNGIPRRNARGKIIPSPNAIFAT